MKVERRLRVSNENGLHARPAMQLVEIACSFASDLTLTRQPTADENEPTVADAKSVMQVITLNAPHGTQLELVADGEDAEAAADALQQLFDDHFGDIDKTGED